MPEQESRVDGNKQITPPPITVEQPPAVMPLEKTSERISRELKERQNDEMLEDLKISLHNGENISTNLNFVDAFFELLPNKESPDRKVASILLHDNLSINELNDFYKQVTGEKKIRSSSKLFEMITQLEDFYKQKSAKRGIKLPSDPSKVIAQLSRELYRKKAQTFCVFAKVDMPENTDKKNHVISEFSDLLRSNVQARNIQLVIFSKDWRSIPTEMAICTKSIMFKTKSNPTPPNI